MNEKKTIDVNQKCWKFIKDMNSTEERLDSVALIDGNREYTYRQMFCAWDRYAEAFSAMGITGRNKSRVLVTGIGSVETMNIFYALNMTGAVYSGVGLTLEVGSTFWKNMVIKEKITDIIIQDFFVSREKFERIMKLKGELGLRNVLLIHIDVNGPCTIPEERLYNKINHKMLRRLENAVYLNDMVEKYEAMPIIRERYNPDKVAAIIHTSGTTSGRYKSLPYTDAGINSVALRFYNDKKLRSRIEGRRTVMTLDIAGGYSMFDQMHMPLAMGCSIVTIYDGVFVNTLWKAISHYKIQVLFFSPSFVNLWGKMPTTTPFDFSSLEAIALGGEYMSAERRRECNRFFNKNGAPDIMVCNGYGLSETGAAILMSLDDNETDSIGHPLYGVKVKIYDESDGKYYDIKDGERTGVLLVNTDCMTTGTLDDEELIPMEVIDGKKYLNTYDAVRVNADQTLTYAGRANRFYVNSDGVRFDAGLIETSIAAQDGIEDSVLVPMYDKRIHDTVPVLYVKTKWNKAQEVLEMKKIIVKIFVKDDAIKTTNMPVKCVFVNEMPMNANGKVDIYGIQAGSIKGRAFNIQPTRVNGKLVDVHMIPGTLTENNFMSVGSALPDELAEERARAQQDILPILGKKAKSVFGQFGDNIDNRRDEMSSTMDERKKEFEEKREERKREFEEKRKEWEDKRAERRQEWLDSDIDVPFFKNSDEFKDFMKDVWDFLDAYRVDKSDLKEDKDFKEYCDKRREATKGFWEDRRKEWENKNLKDFFKDMPFVPIIPIPVPAGVHRRPMPGRPFVPRRVRGMMMRRGAGLATAAAFVGTRPYFVHKRKDDKAPQFHKLGGKNSCKNHGRKHEPDLEKVMDILGLFFNHSPIDYFFEK